MPRIEDDAVVLNRLDYSETSQVVVFFTRRHGKVRAIAKGIRRSTKTRFAPGLDLLEVGFVNLTCRQERSAALATLTEWKPARSLSGLREKLVRLNGALYMAEITGRLTGDWDPHAGLYIALVEKLETLADREDVFPSLVAYQLDLLDAVGFLPRLDVCVSCGRAVDLTHFSSFEGGMICRQCEPARVEKWETSDAAVRTLCRSRSRTDPIQDHPLSKTWAEAFGLLNYHITHLIGSEPRLVKHLVPGRRPIRHGRPRSSR